MKDNLGVGVMVKMIFGDRDTGRVIQESVGKEIKSIVLEEEELTIVFDDSRLVLWDDGQSCCELRYMHTDDKLSDFIGSEFLGAEIRDGPDEEDEYSDVKESQFLVIDTSIGQFTIVNYNEHNGYYGGFAIAGRIA